MVGRGMHVSPLCSRIFWTKYDRAKVNGSSWGVLTMQYIQFPAIRESANITTSNDSVQPLRFAAVWSNSRLEGDTVLVFFGSVLAEKTTKVRCMKVLLLLLS